MSKISVVTLIQISFHYGARDPILMAAKSVLELKRRGWKPSVGRHGAFLMGASEMTFPGTRAEALESLA